MITQNKYHGYEEAESIRLFRFQETIKGKLVRLTTRVGFHHIKGNRRPHWSVTSDVKHGVHASGGCCHDEVLKYQPELTEAVRWHLCDDDGTPMHYVANGFYWLEQLVGAVQPSKYGPQRPLLEVFKDHILFGIVETDEMKLDYILRLIASAVAECEYETAKSLIREEVGLWLEGRRPALENAFEAMRASLSIPRIDETTIAQLGGT